MKGTKMGIVIRALREDDIASVCRQMQPHLWAKDNEMTSYEPERLKAFLSGPQNVLLLAYDGDRIAGEALCYELPHPSGGESSLYVHELDTHPDYRRQGVATALMLEVSAVAKQRGLSWVWLGADASNPAANGLYKKLGPDEAEPGTTYSYKVH